MPEETAPDGVAAPTRVAEAPVPDEAPQAPTSPVASVEVRYELTPVRILGDRDAFYQWGVESRIRNVVAEVVSTEGPISMMEAARRVGAHWGLARIKQKALTRIRSLVPPEQVRIVIQTQ